MESGVRTNGFEWPLHRLQVLGWVVFGIDATCFLIIVLPLLPTMILPWVAVLYSIAVVVLIAVTYKATACDPSDPWILSEQNWSFAVGDEKHFCQLCNRYVQARSKHCRRCSKCVGTFDHHCKWLNNCIGKKNYRFFLGSITATSAVLAITLGSCVYLLVEYATDSDKLSQRAETSHIFRGSTVAPLVLLWIMTVVNVPFYLLDVQLIGLHVFLMHEGMSTYDYIVMKQEREKRKAAGSDEEALAFGGSQRHRSLPHCLDWIFFSSCGQRRRRHGHTGLDRDSMPLRNKQCDKSAANTGLSQSEDEATLNPQASAAKESSPAFSVVGAKSEFVDVEGIGDGACGGGKGKGGDNTVASGIAPATITANTGSVAPAFGAVVGDSGDNCEVVVGTPVSLDFDCHAEQETASNSKETSRANASKKEKCSSTGPRRSRIRKSRRSGSSAIVGDDSNTTAPLSDPGDGGSAAEEERTASPTEGAARDERRASRHSRRRSRPLQDQLADSPKANASDLDEAPPNVAEGVEVELT
eukprot:TRINITY_DN21148_c0_g1_i1.p1 TRINITY_DN21148_c0_g1~~TRINITY_DN21148_c0_g1_i1.p1  ORF type:complete len:527 (+),score=97.54 TRINITY_DN21148_c0_g1_i1:64-1644(+)